MPDDTEEPDTSCPECGEPFYEGDGIMVDGLELCSEDCAEIYENGRGVEPEIIDEKDDTGVESETI